jgi:flagellar biosynthesis protein FlhF
MDYFIEQARTDQEVHAIIRRKYGDRARILSRKDVRVGGFLGMFRRPAVEVTGYFSHAPATPPRTRDIGEERKKILASVGAAPAERAPTETAPATVPTVDAPRAAGAEDAKPDLSTVSAGVQQGRLRFSNATDQPRDDSVATILTELRSLKEQVHARGALEEPAVIGEVREILEYNDFSASYREELVRRLRTTCSLDELDDRGSVMGMIRRWIADGILINEWQDRSAKPRVFVIVGPTGVGKTTTIAKLAAMYGAVSDVRHDVRIITIDSYRIGALYQIEKYGEIMSIPVSPVESTTEMKKQLSIAQEADYVFVDTIGKSPHDLTKLAEVNDLVRSAGGEVHLAISATTKYRDIVDTFRQFEPFDYRSVIVTKLDETGSVGGILSALHEKRKSVSFVTDGQSVPQDIEPAQREIFLRRLRDLPDTPEYDDRDIALVASRKEE